MRTGQSGLTLQAILQGETIVGHGVVISGNPDGSGRRVIAELVVVLPKPGTP
jgi:hypothetical protein